MCSSLKPPLIARYDHLPHGVPKTDGEAAELYGTIMAGSGDVSGSNAHKVRERAAQYLHSTVLEMHCGQRTADSGGSDSVQPRTRQQRETAKRRVEGTGYFSPAGFGRCARAAPPRTHQPYPQRPLAEAGNLTRSAPLLKPAVLTVADLQLQAVPG